MGGLHHREQSFRIEGANTGMAALVALSTVLLVLPAFNISSPGGTYTVAQLLFAALASAVPWAVFVFFQTVRHRDPKDMVLLALSFLTSTFRLVSRRTNIMQGAVHLVIFAAFLFLALVP